jgi:hypothetical protein
MPTKRLLILANSVKKKQHCVAGRVVREDEEGVKYGKWIRPVSRKSEGELTAADCQFQNGRLPKVWEVVDVPLEECEESSSQPENWFIDPHSYWVKVGDQATLGFPPVYGDTPADLWIDKNARIDRISPDALATLDRKRSLYLVPVSDFQIQIDWNSYSGYHRRRAHFRYAGTFYDLSLTDPEMEAHCTPFPARGRSRTITMETGTDKMLCVSLSPPYRGHHYKIVATVLEIAND